jgi:hypothetical protein
MTTNKNDRLYKTFQSLANILLEFNLDYDEFCKSLRHHYVTQAYKTSHTIARTSLKVGIDRRIVSAIINNKWQYYKPSSILTILSKIKKFATIKNKMLVNKKGKRSIESIIHQVAYGATTLNSVIDELIALGCIEDLGNKIKYLNDNVSNTHEQNESLRIFSEQIEQYVQAFIQSNNSLDRKGQLFKFSINRNKIPFEGQAELDSLEYDLLNTLRADLTEIYQKYEQDETENTPYNKGVFISQYNYSSDE